MEKKPRKAQQAVTTKWPWEKKFLGRGDGAAKTEGQPGGLPNDTNVNEKEGWVPGEKIKREFFKNGRHWGGPRSVKEDGQGHLG